MPSKLCRWGNSMGVRLPQYIVERAGLSAGDYLFIKLVDSGEIVIRPVKSGTVPAGYASAGKGADATIATSAPKESLLAQW